MAYDLYAPFFLSLSDMRRPFCGNLAIPNGVVELSANAELKAYRRPDGKYQLLIVPFLPSDIRKGKTAYSVFSTNEPAVFEKFLASIFKSYMPGRDFLEPKGEKEYGEQERRRAHGVYSKKKFYYAITYRGRLITEMDGQYNADSLYGSQDLADFAVFECYFAHFLEKFHQDHGQYPFKNYISTSRFNNLFREHCYPYGYYPKLSYGNDSYLKRVLSSISVNLTKVGKRTVYQFNKYACADKVFEEYISSHKDKINQNGLLIVDLRPVIVDSGRFDRKKEEKEKEEKEGIRRERIRRGWISYSIAHNADNDELDRVEAFGKFFAEEQKRAEKVIRDLGDIWVARFDENNKRVEDVSESSSSSMSEIDESECSEIEDEEIESDIEDEEIDVE